MLDDAVRDKKLAVARRAAQRFVTVDDVDAVYLSGSLLAGLGTSTSDVDLFVVSNHRHEGLGEQLRVDGQRVDVEFRTPAAIREALDCVVPFRASFTDFGQIHLAAKVVDDMVRLYYAADLKTAPIISGARAQLHAAQADLRRLLIAGYVSRIGGLVEDFWGFCRDDDFTSAALLSCDILSAALECFLAACDDFYIGPKWSLRKLDRLAHRCPDLRDSVARLLIWRDSPGGEFSELAAERVRLAQLLLVAAQVDDGWERGEAWRWQEWRDERAGLRRGLHWVPIRRSDILFMTESDVRNVRWSVDGLAMWGFCQGAAPEAVLSQMHNYFGSSLQRTDEEMETALRGMVETGMLVDE